MANSKWCQIHGASDKNLYGHTPENQTVLIPKHFYGMDAVQKGDIVEFDPERFTPKGHKPLVFVVHLYAKNPRLIARGFKQPVPGTRPSNGTELSACDWKAKKESEADQFSAAMQ